MGDKAYVAEKPRGTGVEQGADIISDFVTFRMSYGFVRERVRRAGEEPIVTDFMDNQVCRAENGQFIAFWRGTIVHKFDGALRYFGTEDAAWDFLKRRDGISSSVIGASRTRGSRADSHG